MRRILSLLLVFSAFALCLSSCGLFETVETDATDSIQVVDTNTEMAGNTDNVETDEPDHVLGSAKLVGYCTKDSLYDGEFNSKVGWKAAGMGYIVKTASGKLIVVDGGNTADAEDFYELLKQYSDGEKVVVDYWILTHPHGDHINCLIEMTNNSEILSNLTVNKLVYYFPAGFSDSSGNTCQGYIDKMGTVAQRLNASVIEPRNGQWIYLDDIKIQFLYVATDYEQLNNTNQLSLIFRITAEKSVLFTGDAFTPSLQKLAERYENNTYLKSDILQMPHHFLCDTGYKPFYELVDADAVLLPTCIAGYNAMYNDPSYNASTKHLANDFAAQNASYVYKAFEGNFEIEI